MGVSTKCGPSLGGPHKKHDYILGSVLGSPSPFLESTSCSRVEGFWGLDVSGFRILGLEFSF